MMPDNQQQQPPAPAPPTVKAPLMLCVANDMFMVRVADHRLAPDGILRNDCVIIKPGAEVKDGDYVAVKSDCPAAAVYRYTEGVTNGIIGKVVGLLRSYE